MSIRDWSPGRVSLIERAERLPNLKLAADQDHRTGERYAADLAAATERSLRHSSRRWCPGRCQQTPCQCPNGQPLTEVQRWSWKTSAQVGSRSGIPAHGGRWPDPAPTTGQVST